ncbi:Phosphate/sulfate permease [Archaeoglobus sulfaticallidus PM70-1]|uniref:Phosphate/sulfate permease n=1 Tax=Archaeoglobus sulfaticallidus PM70-1 TaxID=387631 RepID=N0BDY4_9EURY|nr:inorganic phosphate transporter [Archaeoglobus sulfaticallidus]AGK60437.1 Phosphate/sulfate permease [Archaeoglobus sulfaticallidus PM70-1]
MIETLFIVTLLVSIYMAWNIGANDAANSMATSYGSGALTLRQIIIIAGILEFSGAFLFGSRVTKTVGKGIVPIEHLDPTIVTIGALSAILSAGLWITIATYYHLPVSTSHSIVGAMLGFGFAAVAEDLIPLESIKWGVLYKIALSWVVSPLTGALLAFIIFSLIRIFILSNMDVDKVEGVFRYLQVLTACYVAFAHGSNDVANAVGPISATFGFSETPSWILALGGLGIAIGVATWGYRVIETVGKRITELTPTRGFSAEFATATTVLSASYFGMPISTTHTLVGSVLGVGFAGGLASVDISVVKRIIYSWVLTIPAAATLTITIYTLMVVFI